MGRRKKEEISVSQEGIAYIKKVIKEYTKLNAFCKGLEVARPTLFRQGNISIEAFRADAYPSEELLVVPAVPGQSYELLEDYLDAKEKVYLLEHGIWMMEGRTKEVATALFLKRKSWEKTIEEQHISRMTLDRERNKAITLLAREVDTYMEWKVRNIYFG